MIIIDSYWFDFVYGIIMVRLAFFRHLPVFFFFFNSIMGLLELLSILHTLLNQLDGFIDGLCSSMLVHNPCGPFRFLHFFYMLVVWSIFLSSAQIFGSCNICVPLGCTFRLFFIVYHISISVEVLWVLKLRIYVFGLFYPFSWWRFIRRC